MIRVFSAQAPSGPRSPHVHRAEITLACPFFPLRSHLAMFPGQVIVRTCFEINFTLDLVVPQQLRLNSAAVTGTVEYLVAVVLVAGLAAGSEF